MDRLCRTSGLSHGGLPIENRQQSIPKDETQHKTKTMRMMVKQLSHTPVQPLPKSQIEKFMPNLCSTQDGDANQLTISAGNVTEGTLKLNLMVYDTSMCVSVVVTTEMVSQKQ